MTKQEADFIGSMNMCDEISNEVYKKIMCNCEVEEQQPCEDCISLNKLNDIITKAIDDSENQTECQTLRWVIDVMSELPSVTPQQTRWIPVSERLPEEYADVICCTDAEEVFIATYLGKMNDGVDCFDDNNGMMWEGDIIAWMPIPQPYKAESEDEK